MRAIWKGGISFGLVNVPVRLYTATENRDIQFRQVRASDGSRIKYRRVAEADGEEVPYGEIAKGYETPDGRMVVLTEEELKALPSRSSREIAVEKFVDADEIDPVLIDKSYYLEPDKAGAKPYALLREALRDSDRMAVVSVSVRTRMTLGVLRVRDDAIVLQTLMWPDEVRATDELENLDAGGEPTEAEISMANLLIESMAGEFEPNDYEDEYRTAVEALVESKLDGAEAVEAPAAEEKDAGTVVDLLAALQSSVDRARKARGGAAAAGGASEEPDSAPGVPAPSRKPAAAAEGEAGVPAEGEAAKDDEHARDEKPAKTPARKAAAKKAEPRKPAARGRAAKGAKAGENDDAGDAKKAG